MDHGDIGMKLPGGTIGLLTELYANGCQLVFSTSGRRNNVDYWNIARTKIGFTVSLAVKVFISSAKP